MIVTCVAFRDIRVALKCRRAYVLAAYGHAVDHVVSYLALVSAIPACDDLVRAAWAGAVGFFGAEEFQYDPVHVPSAEGPVSMKLVD